MSLDPEKIERELKQFISDFAGRVGENVSKEVYNTIDLQKSDVVSQFALLAPSTVQKKGHDRFLEDTREMMDALTSKKIGDQEVEVGIFSGGKVAERAFIHERGDAEPNIPARPFLVTTLETQRAKDAVEEAFKTELRRLRRRLRGS